MSTLVHGHGFLASVAPKARVGALGIGLVALAGAGLFWHPKPAEVPHSYVLTLDAQAEEGAVYFSAWNAGPLVASHDASDGKIVEYRRDFAWLDGCTWEAVEKLTPVGDRYYYYYVEHFVSCPEGLTPSGSPSPRSGYVHTTRVEGAFEPTALTGTVGWPADATVAADVQADDDDGDL